MYFSIFYWVQFLDPLCLCLDFKYLDIINFYFSLLYKYMNIFSAIQEHMFRYIDIYSKSHKHIFHSFITKWYDEIKIKKGKLFAWG